MTSPNTSASWFVPLEKKCHECLQAIDDTRNNNFITCDKCSCDFHLNCTSLPPYELVKYVKKNLYKRKFICRSCVEKIHPKELKSITLQTQKDITTKTKEQKTQETQTKNTDNFSIDRQKERESFFHEMDKRERKIKELMEKVRILEECIESKEVHQHQQHQKEEEEEPQEMEDPEDSNFFEDLRQMIRQENETIYKALDERMIKIEEKMLPIVESPQHQEQHPRRIQRFEREKEEEEKEEETKETLRSIIREELCRVVEQSEENDPQMTIQRPTSRAPRQMPPYPRPRRCYACGKMGHIARSCLTRPTTGLRSDRRDFRTEEDEVERFRTVPVPREDGTIKFIPLRYLQDMQITTAQQPQGSYQQQPQGRYHQQPQRRYQEQTQRSYQQQPQRSYQQQPQRSYQPQPQRSYQQQPQRSYQQQPQRSYQQQPQRSYQEQNLDPLPSYNNTNQTMYNTYQPYHQRPHTYSSIPPTNF